MTTDRIQAVIDYQAEARQCRLGTGYHSIECRKCGERDNFEPIGNDIIQCQKCLGKQTVPPQVYTRAGLWKGVL